MNYTVYLDKPTHFTEYVEAAGCYIWCQNKLLLLYRHPDKTQGNTWAVPAGKLDPNETPRQAVVREVQEEIGVDVGQDVVEMGKLYIQLPYIAYVHHMFYKTYEDYPKLDLALDENVDACWVTPDEAFSLPLIAGGKEALQFLQRFLGGHKRG